MKKLLDKKYLPYYLGGALLLAVVVAILVISRKSQKDQDDRLINEIEQVYPGIDGFQIISDAKAIHQAFGLDSAWYNPSGWVEDEDAIIDILAAYDRQSFRILEEAYREHSNGRYLQADLREYFDADQIEEIDHLL